MFICSDVCLHHTHTRTHTRAHAHTHTHTQHGTYRVAEEAVAGVDTTNNIGDYGAAVEAYPYLYCSFAFVGCVFVCVCMCVLKPRIETDAHLLQTHTHARAHTQTHKRTYTLTRTRMCVLIHLHTSTDTIIQTHKQTCFNRRNHTDMLSNQKKGHIYIKDRYINISNVGTIQTYYQTSKPKKKSLCSSSTQYAYYCVPPATPPSTLTLSPIAPRLTNTKHVK